MATPLLLMSSTEDRNPEPKSDPNPGKGRGRKSSKAQQNQKNKQPQRGMGVAQLETLLRQQQHHHDVTPLPQHHTHYGFPVQRGPELPSIHPSYLSYKKKRVIGDEIGFTREKGKCGHSHSNAYNFSGFSFPAYTYGSEVVAIHKKGSGSGNNNVMMEYGFFPENEGWKMMMMNQSCVISGDNNNNNNNIKKADLNLKMGYSDSSSSSPSPSCSSLSSLTTATTTCSDLDLSLKLSY